MRRNNLYYLIAVVLIASITMAFAGSNLVPLAKGDVEDTRLETITKEVSDEAFDKMMQVLTHKRCVNCHPSGDRPRQGEDSHYHNFGVRRGPDNHGVAALKCESCHQPENNNLSGVPGAPEWSLAPISMAWEGLSRVEIAQSMLDPTKNGGRSLEEIVEHLTEHALVLWAWEPGIDAEGNPREKPPVPKEEYIQAVKEWAESGAHIPAQ